MRTKSTIVVTDVARKQSMAALREYCAANVEEEVGDLGGACSHTEFPSSTHRKR